MTAREVETGMLKVNDLGRLAEFGFTKKKICYEKDIYKDDVLLVSILVYSEDFMEFRKNELRLYVAYDEAPSGEFDASIADSTIYDMAMKGIVVNE